jgi:hypothetical protein
VAQVVVQIQQLLKQQVTLAHIHQVKAQMVEQERLQAVQAVAVAVLVESLVTMGLSVVAVEQVAVMVVMEHQHQFQVLLLFMLAVAVAELIRQTEHQELQ